MTGPTRPTRPEELQADLDAAQLALERHVGGLKEAVTDLVAGKLEEKATQLVKLVRRPFAWLEAHAFTFAAGALVAGAALGMVRSMLYHRARCAASARLGI